MAKYIPKRGRVLEVSIIPLDDDKNSRLLCEILDYPREDLNICNERFHILRSIGVEAIILEGDTLLRSYHILGKGTNSIVIKLLYSGGYAVGKILRSDASRESLKREADILNYVRNNSMEKLKIAPELYQYMDWILIMEYIEGRPIGEYLSDELYSLTRDEVRNLLYNIFLRLYYLDKIGVDHGELSNPYKHIYIIEEDLDAIILDFESASLNRPPKNLTSVYQFLFRSSNASSYLTTLLGINFEKVIPILKEYKLTRSYDNFLEILKYSNIID